MNAGDIRVAIADDHALIHEGLARLLTVTANIGVVDTYTNAASVLRAASSRVWDVLVLDVGLGDAFGIDVLERLLAQDADLSVVIYSMYPIEQLGPRCMRAGARSYVCKSDDPALLIEAIRRAAAGRRYVYERLADVLVESQGSRGAALSPRESDVLQLLANGASNSDIARRLHISASTVSTHLANVREKLQVASNNELIARWRDQSFLQLATISRKKE